MMRARCLCKALVLVATVAAALSATAGSGLTSETGPIPLARVPYIFDIAVDRGDPAYLFLATRSGVYRAAPDGTAVRVSITRNRFGNLASHRSLKNVLYAIGIPDSGGNPSLIVSTDSGRTWRHLGEGDEEPLRFRRIDVSKSHPATMYGLRDGLWVKRGGGGTWVRLGSPPGWPYDIAASSLHPGTVYAATSGGLHRSTDGGLSWKHASPELCRQPATVVETSADGIVYAFSLCNGLLRGDERTGEWVIMNKDFGGCIVQHLAIDPTGSDRLYVVTRCKGVFASLDGGRSWNAFGSDETTRPSCQTNPYGRFDPGPLETELAPDEVKYVPSQSVVPTL